MTDGCLELRFGEGSPSGFTPSGIASFSDLRPAAVVRELIQNSLDAAVEAEVPTATVRFRLTRIRTRDVPGMTSYRKTFFAALKTHEEMGGGTLPSQAERVAQVIFDAVKQDEQDILSVLDNGIGLDEDRMTALLSDGVSAKGGSATGTFGNGHSVAIPASDLRYVLYGGVTPNGERIGAGHAVLASSIQPNHDYQISGDGFLVKGFSQGKPIYARTAQLPDLIKQDLDDIQHHSGHGTAVAIVGFNNFREDDALWQMVSKAAASNFFQAVEEGKLVVQVEDCRPGQSNPPCSLNRSSLKAILAANQDEKRSSAFLSGQRAFDAHDALKYGEPHSVETKLGRIGVRIRNRRSGTPRIDLCRNGMWITDDKYIPGFYYRFQDRKPFHALLLLDSLSGGRLHELVRNAEGPLHDKLDVRQRLSKSEARELRNALGEVREWLRSTVPEIGSESFSPDDILALDFGEDGPGGKSRRSFWGSPVPVVRREPSFQYDDRIPGPGKDERTDTKIDQGVPSQNRRPRPVLRPFFQAACVPLGCNHRRIHLECQEDLNNAELRLCIDENVDATCDSLRRDEIENVVLNRVKIDGRRVNGDALVRQDGLTVGVRLGDIPANSSLELEVRYEFPSDLIVLSGKEPALRVEIFRGAPTGGQGD